MEGFSRSCECYRGFQGNMSRRGLPVCRRYLGLWIYQQADPIYTYFSFFLQSALCLNSHDAFLLNRESIQYIWFGEGTPVTQRSFIHNLATTLCQTRSQVLINEGKEPSGFWDALGGHKIYANADYLKIGLQPPRLFECTFSTGDFYAEEIPDFNQDDLSMDYVYILDSRHEIYVWMGSNAPDILRKASMKIALEYSRLLESLMTASEAKISLPTLFSASTKKTRPEKSLRSSSSEGTHEVYSVQAGHEPLLFTCHFHGWIGLADLNTIQLERIASHDLQISPDSSVSPSFSYAVLLQRPLPEGVNPHSLQSYLNKEEFVEVFGMSPQQFAQLPEWIQISRKREAGLF